MTTNDVFGRNLSTWLREDAEHHVPDHLAEVLQRTAATRQRPAWSSLERWLPMDTTFRRSVFGRPAPVRQMALLLLIALLIAALVAIAVGTRPSTLEPYGLARNGDIVASRDGDIYMIDAATSAQSLVVGDEGFDFSPVYSRDGSSFAFLRSDDEPGEPAMLTLMVADAEGSNVRPLTPAIASLDWFDWSPDGSQIAFISRVDGDGVITVVDVDGGESTTFGIGQPAMFATWLPPDGDEILVRGEQLADGDPPPAIFAIQPDGESLPRQISTTVANNEFDFQSIAVAPDGSNISFTRWSSSGTPRVYILDLVTGGERVLPTPNGTRQRGSAVFSPDGTFVAYSRIFPEGAYQLVVAPADGSTTGRVLGPRLATTPDGAEVGSTYAFTPDGSAVIAMYAEDGTSRRLPVDGSPGIVVFEGGAFNFTDMQRLAP